MIQPLRFGGRSLCGRGDGEYAHSIAISPFWGRVLPPTAFRSGPVQRSLACPEIRCSLAMLLRGPKNFSSVFGQICHADLVSALASGGLNSCDPWRTPTTHAPVTRLDYAVGIPANADRLIGALLLPASEPHGAPTFQMGGEIARKFCARGITGVCPTRVGTWGNEHRAFAR